MGRGFSRDLWQVMVAALAADFSRGPPESMRIGILAVQGDYEAHARVLERLGVEYFFVRTPEEAAPAEAMILPGG